MLTAQVLSSLVTNGIKSWTVDCKNLHPEGHETPIAARGWRVSAECRRPSGRGRPLRKMFASESSTSFLAADDFWVVDPARGVPGVNHQLGFLHDALVVVVRMIGDDQHAIVLAEIFQRRALHLQVVSSAPPDEWEVGIVVADLRAFFLQKFDNRE